jgi:hypothetical protein
MFQSVIQDAKRAIGATIERAVERAIVAVPLIVSLGFATAALTAYLTEVYGSRIAYTIIAAIFAVLGLIVALSMPTVSEDLAGENAEPEKKAEGATHASASGLGDLGGSLTSIATLVAGNPRLALAGVTLLLRNVPMLLMVGLMTYLLLNDTHKKPEAEAAVPPAEAAE